MSAVSDVFKYRRNCVLCGKPFGTNGAAAVRCPACIREAKNRRAREKRAVDIAKKNALKEVEKSRRVKTRCPYCGVDTFNGAFCGECLEYGNNFLYEQFGSTNGWDAPPQPPKVEAEDGWRGNKVIGGFATSTCRSE